VEGRMEEKRETGAEGEEVGVRDGRDRKRKKEGGRWKG